MRGRDGDPGPRGAREAQGPWVRWGRGAHGLGLNGAMLGSSLSSAMTVWCLQASPEPL